MTDASRRAERPLLQMEGIVKSFPGVRALDGVDLDVRAGEVHCLLGQNGAGKSTLIKVLAGAHQPDAGTIHWQGEKVRLSTPMSAVRLGIATMYQELDLVDGLSVADNVYLGHEQATAGVVRGLRTKAAASDLLARLGHPEIRPDREVGRLSAAGKQIVSMARALSHHANLIVMDEPSAVLDSGEVQNLFRVIQGLTAQGVAVVYISHRLQEIREIGDRVTVLKDGASVASGLPARDTPTQDVVRLMTGRRVEYAFPPRRSQPADDVLLRVEDLSRAGEFEPTSFDIRRGEVVGIAGLVGSGRSEILETVYGARRASTGRVVLDGQTLRPGSTTAAVRAGMGLSPEERKSQGLIMHESVARNVSLASLRRFSRGGWLRRRDEMDEAARVTRSLDLRPPDPERPVRTLSGGNQQKAVLGRWLLRECRLLLLDEPTRGVDVGARSELYQLIRQLSDSGVGILLVSSEIPEVLGLSDRVLVVGGGRVLAERPAEELDEPAVLDLVMSGKATAERTAS